MKKIVLILLVLLSLSSFAEAEENAAGPKLKLPDYYVGHWTKSAIRTGDFSYFLQCDGTGEMIWNWGRKEKSEDLSYRVLSISKDNEALLMVRSIHTHWQCKSWCDREDKKKADCIPNCTRPLYSYWLLSPSESLGSKFKMMMIESNSLDQSSSSADAEAEAAFLQSDAFLIDIYEKNEFSSSGSTSSFYFESSLPCTQK